jgi:protein-L-isoaspartate(D-aspartate) O-methyltransferase
MTQRPGFPVKLSSSGTTRSANKTASGALGQKPSTLQPSLNASQKLAKAASAAMANPVSEVSGLGLDSAAVRDRMVRKLAEQGVQDARVLSAMGLVERHRFVESALVNQAYEDTSLPIGLGQTISKPNVVARMIELLCQDATGKLGRILEIGTGCGYQAAVLSHVASEVYSIERLRGLHEKARTHLRPFRLHNVHLIFGDGMLGYPKGAPYAGIISAAGGESVPGAWLEQLAVGGRLIAPTITPAGHQALVVILKTTAGFERQVLETVHFVPLKSGVA